MWIVRLALRRPYTFVVMALLIAVLGVAAIVTMTVDIFPAINIPVVTVIWNYSGLSPTEMQNRIVTVTERAFTTTVNGIEHIESVSLRGVAITRLYFHPNVPIEAAIAQVNAQAQQIVRVLPPGIFPPLIIQYNAASVPVLLASLSSDQLPEEQLNDLGNNFIRTQLVTIQGASVPVPYGGKLRVVNVDIDPDALYARGLSPQDVTNAILAQNVILPAGTAKIGTREYDIATNSSPELLNELNDIPIRYTNGAMVYVRDVGFVHDGFSPQTNLVRRDGRHSALLPILSNGSASTLTVVSQARQMMPKILAGLPPSLKVDFLFDQSVFVRAAITGVLHEGVIAGCLTGLMILLFLGSWRSTLIVVTSIPLSILTSIIMLNILHQSLNVMTLGGMALAVGILVDDATVEIENNHRHIDLGKPLRHAILDGAAEVATPAFVATLSICIVFVPILFLGGVGGALFAPLAMSVVFAMLASYFLSRTLVPTMVLYLLAPEARARERREAGQDAPERRSLFGRIAEAFEVGLGRLTARYEGVLDWALAHTRTVIAVFLLFAAVSLFLYPFVGRDFFPTVDAGQLRLHARAPAGTRIEETERYFQRVEDYIRQVIPARELAAIIDNIGIPNPINLALSDSVTVGTADGEILVSLNTPHGPTAGYLKRLRDELPRQFPDLEFFAQPADIVSQILNFGLPAPIDIQVTGPLADSEKNYEVATQIAAELRGVPGAVDVHVQQILDAPRIMIDTDRALAQQVGLTQRDVANSLLISLTGSGATTTNFWLNYKNGVSYQVVVQTPQHRVPRRAASHPGGDRGPIVAPAAEQPGRLPSDDHAVVPEPLQRPAGVRRVRERPGHRSGFGLEPRRPAHREAQRTGRQGQLDRRAWPGAEHEPVVLPAGAGNLLRGPVRLFPDGGQLPVVAGSPHHPDGAPRRAGRHPLGALRHADDHQRARPHGLHHGHRGRDVEQHPDDHLRQRATPPGLWQPRREWRRAGGRADAASSGPHDGTGHAPRHVPHEPRPRGRGRAERAARPRGHRRAARRHLLHAVLRSGSL